ncbi:MAG: hypothetical protein HC897_11955, partial [Thermoanaerobaculia bacterium]|nr:hypothetical protein [Thermoanaerobaculia bacterium]
YQFDHALNQFVDAGKGTVSEDGTVIVSDPGFGVTHAGWGWARVPRGFSTCDKPPCEDRDPLDCKKVIEVDCGVCRVENEPDGKMCVVNERHPGFCEAGRCNTCPTSVTVKARTELPLGLAYPGLKTGLGLIAAMEVHPSEINWVGTQIAEVLTFKSNNCPFPLGCTGGPPFTVHLGGNEYGIPLPRERNVFFDVHTVRAPFSALHLDSGPLTCTAVCTQSYLCGTKVIGTFIITRKLEAIAIDGVEATKVTVTKE